MVRMQHPGSEEIHQQFYQAGDYLQRPRCRGLCFVSWRKHDGAVDEDGSVEDDGDAEERTLCVKESVIAFF